MYPALSYRSYILAQSMLRYGNPSAQGRTRSRKIQQFKHYCTDAPI